MSKIVVNFENCYGIKKLNYTFDFSRDNSYLIYAPNGVMKSSFALIFEKYSKNLKDEIKDRIYLDRSCLHSIKDENANEMDGNNIFVINSYDSTFKSEKTSLLLVSEDLKQQFNSIYREIDEKKLSLINKINKLSGIPKIKIEEEFFSLFAHTDKDFLELLLSIKNYIDTLGLQYSDIKYNSIFNETTLQFLKSSQFTDLISEYLEIYDKLLEDSKYFKKGIFNHYNADIVGSSLKDNKFFEANHGVILKSGEDEIEIESLSKFKELISDDINIILDSKELKDKFSRIDTEIAKKKELRELRSFLEKNQKYLSELDNIDNFRRNLLLFYLKIVYSDYIDLIDTYNTGKKKLLEIMQEANSQRTQWEEVVEIFNNRFFVPFTLKIRDKSNLLIKGKSPTIFFVYDDNGDKKEVDEDGLMKVLSNGEKKALYILNLIFEIKARENSSSSVDKHLLIFDDIADSFDYKNKYAIIEYLKEIKENGRFNLIILTHNFDFFRTIHSRGIVKYNRCSYAYKNNDGIKLEQAEGINNPFIINWKQNLSDFKKAIPSICFIRNLIEYINSNGTQEHDYLKLTSLLHYKKDTESIILGDYENIINNCFGGIVNFPDKTLKVFDIIIIEAENCLSCPEGVNLENKIILSIAIRLLAEKYMLEKINDSQFIDDLQSMENQTFTIFKKYRDLFSSDINLKLFEQILIMVPENIHLNSFMYEPILDLSDCHLKSLYSKIKDL